MPQIQSQLCRKCLKNPHTHFTDFMTFWLHLCKKHICLKKSIHIHTFTSNILETLWLHLCICKKPCLKSLFYVCWKMEFWTFFTYLNGSHIIRIFHRNKCKYWRFYTYLARYLSLSLTLFFMHAVLLISLLLYLYILRHVFSDEYFNTW